MPPGQIIPGRVEIKLGEGYNKASSGETGFLSRCPIRGEMLWDRTLPKRSNAMMKKLLSLVLVSVVIFSLSVTAWAANIDISTDSQTINVADEVIVTVTLEQDIPVEAGATVLQGELEYDGAVLEFQEIVEKSTQLANAAKHVRDNRVLFNYLSMNNSAVGFTKGTLVKIRFKAVADLASDHVNCAMNFTAYVQNAQGVDVGELTYPASVNVLVCKEHSWDGGKVTTQPACTEKGVKTYTCTFSGCDRTKTEEIPAAGHIWDEGKVTREPTTVQTGMKLYTCVCGETRTEEIAQKESVNATGDVDEDGGEEISLQTQAVDREAILQTEAAGREDISQTGEPDRKEMSGIMDIPMPVVWSVLAVLVAALIVVLRLKKRLAE